MKVLGVVIIIVALAIIIVPQFTNCESGQDNAATKTITITKVGSASAASSAGTESGGMPAAASLPYRMMKCFWSARAEIAVGVALLVVGALLLFARRKDTTRALGIIAAVLGVLTILIPTTFIGTCANARMVCNTEMKPTLLIAGGITVALGIAVLVMGEMKRDSGGTGATPA